MTFSTVRSVRGVVSQSWFSRLIKDTGCELEETRKRALE